jgi:hypothetical protein
MCKRTLIAVIAATILFGGSCRPAQEPSWDFIAYGMVKEGRCEEAQALVRARNDIANPYWYTCLADTIASCGTTKPNDTQAKVAMDLLELGFARLRHSARIQLKMAMIQSNAGQIEEAKRLTAEALLAARLSAASSPGGAHQDDDRLVIQEAEFFQKALEPRAP